MCRCGFLRHLLSGNFRAVFQGGEDLTVALAQSFSGTPGEGGNGVLVELMLTGNVIGNVCLILLGAGDDKGEGLLVGVCDTVAVGNVQGLQQTARFRKELPKGLLCQLFLPGKM